MANPAHVLLADHYRACSRALRIVGNAKAEDLGRTYRIVHYLYEQGHESWVKLFNLSVDDFAAAFDNSRAKDPTNTIPRAHCSCGCKASGS